MNKGRNGTKRIKRVKQRKQMIEKGIFVSACVLIAFGVVWFILRGYVNKVDKDVIYDNVYVESVNASGMKKAEVKKALAEKEAEYQARNMVFHVEDKNVTLTLGELGFSIGEIDKCVAEAVSYGKEGNVWSRYRKVRKLKKEKQVVPVSYKIDEEKVKAVLAEKAQPLENEAENASIRRENGEFIITDEVAGKTVDAEASVKAIEQYLNKKWKRKDGEVTLVSITDEPKVKRADLEVIQNRLGTFTTYCGSGGGRVQNIQTGAGLINGDVIMPGEEYSANAAMEPYTEENGFTTAGSYESGKVVQTMGGGICQVSSTLYNAVILAELEVTQRQPHSMLVNYVEPSMDAAIAGDVKDLKFRNNTKYPIFVEGYLWNGNITFNIYGKETRPDNREIEYISETLSSQEPAKKFEASGSALGTMERGGSPHTGKVAQLWKVVRENGQEVSREVFNKSRYSMSPVIIKVGTASDNAEAAALVNAAIASQDEGQINAAIAAAKAKIEEAASKAAEEAAKKEAENKAAEEAAKKAAEEAADQPAQ